MAPSDERASAFLDEVFELYAAADGRMTLRGWHAANSHVLHRSPAASSGRARTPFIPWVESHQLFLAEARRAGAEASVDRGVFGRLVARTARAWLDRRASRPIKTLAARLDESDLWQARGAAKVSALALLVDECSIEPSLNEAHILPSVAVYSHAWSNPSAPVRKLQAAVIREGTDPRAPLRRKAGGFLGAWRAHHAEAAARGATVSDLLAIGSPAARLPSARSAEADVSMTTPRTPAGRGRVAPPLDLCSFNDLAASFTAAADRPVRSPDPPSARPWSERASTWQQVELARPNARELAARSRANAPCAPVATPSPWRCRPAASGHYHDTMPGCPPARLLPHNSSPHASVLSSAASAADALEQSCAMTAAAERRAIAEGIANAHARARSA